MALRQRTAVRLSMIVGSVCISVGISAVVWLARACAKEWESANAKSYTCRPAYRTPQNRGEFDNMHAHVSTVSTYWRVCVCVSGMNKMRRSAYKYT